MLQGIGPPEIRQLSLFLTRLIIACLNEKLQVSNVCFGVPIMIFHFFLLFNLTLCD